MKILIFISQIPTTWILIGASILFHLSASQNSKNDYEIFSPSGLGERSQSIYHSPEFSVRNFFDSGVGHTLNKRFAEIKLEDLEQISEKPSFTQSYLYVSPKDAERRFTRSSDYDDGYKEFLAKYFAISEKDESNEKNSEYQAERPHKQHSSRYEAEEDEDDNVEEVEGTDHNSSEYDRIKLLSQKQEKEIKQNPKHCKTVVKDDMKCHQCKNPDTGAHSETCSFSSEPEAKKFAYTRERNYKSKDGDKGGKNQDDGEDDEEDEEEYDDEEEQPKPKPVLKKKIKHTETPRHASPKRQQYTSGVPTTQRTKFDKLPARSEPLRNSEIRRPTYRSSYNTAESRPQREVIGTENFQYEGEEGKMFSC